MRCKSPLPIGRGSALAAAALLLFALLAFAVRVGWVLRFDGALSGVIRDSGGGVLLQPMIVLTDLGSLPVLFAETALAALLLVGAGRRGPAARLAAIAGGGRIVVELIKLAVARARPPLIDQAVAVHSFSFPSSHTANATITYCALALALTQAAGTRRFRPAALAAAAALALAVGFSRVWLGVHWPSDVIAGWLFGAGWLILFGGPLAERR